MQDTTQIIPTTELSGIESALAKADQFHAQLEPLFSKARTIIVVDQPTYSELGSVLSETRSIRKNQIAPLYAPFEGIIQRAKDWLKQSRLGHDNLAEQIEGICVAKLKEFENAEREAAKKEAAKLNKGKAPEECATVVPNLPTVAGYRKSVTYPVEVQSFEAFMKAYATAISKKDKPRAQFLREFLALDEKALAGYARELKDPEKFNREVPGCHCQKA